MKLAYVDRNGNPQMLEGFDTMSDDDEWVTMIFNGSCHTSPEVCNPAHQRCAKKKMLHKCDIFERTYIVYTEEV